MSDGTAKQQIVDKIKSNTNILVTVSNDPSVDELSAALGLTLLLNKMKKHATAVFSGQMPPVINFLNPDKTFENTVDSLRDFIIALDKEKADHLRYKIEGDVVKIFITPYRTTITSEDLDFSQGDYNVELVLALGVKNQDSLDKALEAHGRILHDAVVATIMAGSEKSDLGSISWQEENASSLGEMMVGLSETLKTDKVLLDEQIATAFLAGIVAATERFSNNRTSARVMTMAAQLMGAGANQQMIASKFEEAGIGVQATDKPASDETSPPVTEDTAMPPHNDGTIDLSEDESTKLDRKQKKESAPVENDEPAESERGTLSVSHEKEGTIDEVREQTVAEDHAMATEAANEELARAVAIVSPEDELANQLTSVAAAPPETLSVEDMKNDIAAASADVSDAAKSTSPELKGAVSSDVWKDAEPTFGGTLNATATKAEEDNREAIEEDRNRTILSHSGFVGDSQPSFSSPFNAASLPLSEPPIVNPLAEDQSAPGQAPAIQPPTLEDIDRQNRLPKLDMMNGELPPLPDFSTLPPLPPTSDADNGSQAPSQPVEKSTPPAKSQDPGQFRIPGNPAS